MSAEKLTKDTFNPFLSSFDTILCDCDGVLWGEDGLQIPGSIAALKYFESLGKTIYLVTNNGSRTKDAYTQRCSTFGFDIVPDHIITASSAAALYLKHHLPSNKKVYMIGSNVLRQELQNVGVQCIGHGADRIPDTADMSNYKSFLNNHVNLDPNIGAVVVGPDFHISFVKLTKAISYLQDKSCLFLSTNKDVYFNNEGILPFYGTLPFVRPVEIACGRESIITGKPSKNVLLGIKEPIDVKRTIMIGDYGPTDMLLGSNTGIRTLLVLTGISTEQQIQEWKESKNQEEKKYIPNYYVSSLGQILEWIK